ncbi:MAG: hypothetical protein F6K30_17845, partial [Cyanothece sp. SIO2G6]|nr:hypothetical protein [Cyanothece sp. SIO2G6]
MKEKMHELELQYNSLKFRISRSANQALQRFRDNSHIAVLRYDHPISNAQTFPITETVPGTIQFHDMSLFSEHIQNSKSQYQLIFIQSIWDVSPETLVPVLDKIHKYQSNAKVVFLDWYAPIHIPQPEILEMVDLYVKKQVLKEHQQYTGMYNTNLLEYENQHNDNYQCNLANIRYIQVDLDILSEKLFTGWNFATDRRLTEQLKKKFYLNKDRPIDVHCRIFAPSERKSWYQHMRGRAYDAVQEIAQKRSQQFKILSENARVPYHKYINELAHSKLCISPFGYGEICWRDFEAILAG